MSNKLFNNGRNLVAPQVVPQAPKYKYEVQAEGTKGRGLFSAPFTTPKDTGEYVGQLLDQLSDHAVESGSITIKKSPLK